MNLELSQIAIYGLVLAAGWILRHKEWLIPVPKQPAPSGNPVLDEIRALLQKLLSQQQPLAK
jgi:hypothetical protein